MQGSAVRRLFVSSTMLSYWEFSLPFSRLTAVWIVYNYAILINHILYHDTQWRWQHNYMEEIQKLKATACTQNHFCMKMFAESVYYFVILFINSRISLQNILKYKSTNASSKYFFFFWKEICQIYSSVRTTVSNGAASLNDI